MLKGPHLIWSTLWGGTLVFYGMTHWGQTASLPEQQCNIYSFMTPFVTIILLMDFYCYIQLRSLTKTASYWTDKINIWFMPLTWRSSGLFFYAPNAEITVEDHGHSPSTMSVRTKGYFVFHTILCLFLMTFSIPQSLGWTTLERWLGAAVLWHTVVHLSSILEAHAGLYTSELIRLGFLGLIGILFNDWHAHPICLVLLGAITAVSTWWTHRHFTPIEHSLKNAQLPYS